MNFVESGKDSQNLIQIKIMLGALEFKWNVEERMLGGAKVCGEVGRIFVCHANFEVRTATVMMCLMKTPRFSYTVRKIFCRYL